MSGPNDFNRIAGIYDSIGQIVFGNTLRQSQSTYLDTIKTGDSVLIVGGGSGQLLTELENLQIPIKIEYLEKSQKMINLSKLRGPFKYLSINFIHADLLESQLNKYNVIITNFFLDVFEEHNLQIVIAKLSGSLKVKGLWLVTDFVSAGKPVQNLLISAMYRFFKIVVNLEGNKLLDFEKYLQEAGFAKRKSRKFYYQMIESCVYKRYQ